MRINDDFETPVLVNTKDLPWLPSPAAGVHRRMLFRIGEEVARATSIVRYAPESTFPRHTHGGGEEIVVLDGVFQDEHGDYPAGSYFRNPPGTSHVPASKHGCTIFVRLWQFRENDHEQIVRLPGDGRELIPRGGAARALELFNDGHEEVRIEDWTPGGLIAVQNPRGLELLLIEGSLVVDGQVVTTQGWVRLPRGETLEALVGSEGAKVWLKNGPLLHAEVCQFLGR